MAWLPGAIIGVLSMLLTLAIYQSNRKASREQIQVDDFRKLIDRVGNLEIGHAETNVKMAVFWKDVSFDFAKILHQPHISSAELDDLIEKYLASILTVKEMKRFIVLLTLMRDGQDIAEGKRLAASQMLQAMKRCGELLGFETAIKEMLIDQQQGLEQLGQILDSREHGRK
jgi:hypothetical protein